MSEEEKFTQFINLRSAVKRASGRNLDTRHFEGYYNSYTEAYGDTFWDIVEDMSKVSGFKDTAYYWDSISREYAEHYPGDGGEPKRHGIQKLKLESLSRPF